MREIEEAGEELVAIYHSHTKSAAYPSQTDINLAGWPEAVYLIVSLADPEAPDLKGFWIVDGKIADAELVVGGQAASWSRSPSPRTRRRRK